MHANRPSTHRDTNDLSEDSDRPPGYWALLRAVPRVVARVGLRGLTYRAVAKDAGVTYGLISYYFGSRDVLIEAATRLATDEAIARSKVGPSSDRVQDFAAGVSKLLAEDPDAQAFQYELVCEARRSRPLLAAVERMYENYVAAISASLDKLGIEHDEALARVVFAALDGIVLQRLVHDDEKMTDETIEALQGLLAGLGRRRRTR